MDQRTEQILSQLDREIKTSCGEGKLIETAAALGQKGAIYAQHRQWTASAQAFDEVIQLAVETGETGGEAMARYGQGMALFQIPARQKEARQAFEQAVALATKSGQRTLAAKAHFILHSFYLEANDLSGSIAQLTSAIDLVDPTHEPQLAVQMYQTRASVYFLSFQLNQAQTDLDEALIAARQSGDKKLILAIQLDRQVLNNLTTANPGKIDALLDSLLAQARQTGNREIMGDVKLHRAIVYLQTGRPKQALRCAQEVRQQVLQSSGHQRYMRYLIACLLIAQAQESLEKRPEVLAVLLTCKKTFEANLGKEAGRIVVPFLDALHYRWGPEALQEALQIYQEQMQ